MPELILVTGGVRSGKSRYAVEIASRASSRVTFIATASPCDEEMIKRIKLHQSSRPSHWETVEERRDVASVLSKIDSPHRTVIIDCLTMLISNLLLEGEEEKSILKQVQAIAENGKKFNRLTVVVTNEVGWGVVPQTSLGRNFRDIAGVANQIMAKNADQVWLIICGVPWRLK